MRFDRLAGDDSPAIFAAAFEDEVPVQSLNRRSTSSIHSRLSWRKAPPACFGVRWRQVCGNVAGIGPQGYKKVQSPPPARIDKSAWACFAYESLLAHSSQRGDVFRSRWILLSH